MKMKICLLLAFLIILSVDRRYIDDLKILTSIELYLNSEFYDKHPFCESDE